MIAYCSDPGRHYQPTYPYIPTPPPSSSGGAIARVPVAEDNAIREDTPEPVQEPLPLPMPARKWAVIRFDNQHSGGVLEATFDRAMPAILYAHALRMEANKPESWFFEHRATFHLFRLQDLGTYGQQTEGEDLQ